MGVVVHFLRVTLTRSILLNGRHLKTFFKASKVLFSKKTVVISGNSDQDNGRGPPTLPLKSPGARRKRLQPLNDGFTPPLITLYTRIAKFNWRLNLYSNANEQVNCKSDQQPDTQHTR
jgi:hypothetical protein